MDITNHNSQCDELIAWARGAAAMHAEDVESMGGTWSEADANVFEGISDEQRSALRAAFRWLVA